MRVARLIAIIPVIAALNGCVMLKKDEWVMLQQDVSDLKKTTESIRLQAEQLQKNTAAEFLSRIASVEKGVSDTERDLRKKQAEMVADITSIRSDFQILTGRFEEVRYSVRKGLLEGKSSKEDSEQWNKETLQRLEELQKRIASLEQSMIILQQEKEGIKEKLPEALEDVYKDAYETYQKGDFGTARKKFQRYIETFPDSKYAENAQYWMGESYYSEKDYEKAIVEFDNVIKKYPDGIKAPAALLKEGMAFSALGDKKNANILFKKLLEKYPRSEQAEVAKKLKE